jgi:hypothetical protein
MSTLILIATKEGTSMNSMAMHVTITAKAIITMKDNIGKRIATMRAVTDMKSMLMKRIIVIISIRMDIIIK